MFHTILSSNQYRSMPETRYPELTPYEGSLLSADYSPINVHDRDTLNIHMEGRDVRHDVLFTNISKDRLLGMAYLQMHGMAIDFAQETVSWAGERLAYEQACRVQLAEDIVIPAGMRTLVPGIATKPLATGNWVMEALVRTPGNIPMLAGKILV